MAKRILDKLEKRIELSSVESNYAAKGIKDKDGLFNMIEEYKYKDTTILNYNFDKLKNGLLSFEKSLKVNYKRNDFSCPDKKCRIKIAFNINSSSKQYIYYVDGCEKLKTMLFKSLGLRN